MFSTHLEQITTCARSIADLPFHGPKAFTNAILSTSDITSLIRDTEAHEKALYHLAPPEVSTDSNTAFATTQSTAAARRRTVFPPKQPRNRAVATVLGGNLYEQLQHQPKGEVDVALLLHGARKLADVYPIAGAAERISKLERRFQQLETNIAHYESRVAEQRQELGKMSNLSVPEAMDISPPRAEPVPHMAMQPTESYSGMQEDVEALEHRKKALEDRVSGMDRDLNELNS